MYLYYFVLLSYIPIHENPNLYMKGVGMGDQTIWQYCLSTWPRQAIPKSVYFLNFIFFSDCSEKQPSNRFPWDFVFVQDT